MCSRTTWPAPVAALAMLLLAGCGGLDQTTTLGEGNPSGYRPGRTLVATLLPEGYRPGTESKMVEHLAELGVAAEVSAGLVQSNQGAAIVDDAARLERFETVLLLTDYEREVETVQVGRSVGNCEHYPGKQYSMIGGILDLVLIGTRNMNCGGQHYATWTEQQVRVTYRVAMYDVPSRTPVWEGVNSRTVDLPADCFAVTAASDVVNWLLREGLLPGQRPLLSMSGKAVRCAMAR